MPQDFSSLLSSEAFTVVSRDGRSFLVHGSILAAQSAPLKSFISGGWKESTERTIHLKDWDGDTVSRFVEFLYTGDYQYSGPEVLYSETDIEEEESIQAEPSTGPEDEEQGQNRPLTPLDLCLDPKLNPKLCKEKKTCVDFEEDVYPCMLLAHAKVYALAQYKGVTALKALSLRRLLDTLLDVDYFLDCADDRIAADIAELLDYVYANIDSPKGSEEPMRRVVSQFAALHITKLQAKEEMKELMSKGGDLVNDLMRKVCRRIVALEEMEE